MCLDCGAVFDEPKVIKEPFGEIRDVCPNCNGDFVRALRCDVCHEYITGTFAVTKDKEIICGDCFTEYDITDDWKEIM